MAKVIKPTATALTAQRHAALRHDVQQLAETAERATNHTKAQAFHRLGRRIERERLKHAHLVHDGPHVHDHVHDGPD